MPVNPLPDAQLRLEYVFTWPRLRFVPGVVVTSEEGGLVNQVIFGPALGF